MSEFPDLILRVASLDISNRGICPFVAGWQGAIHKGTAYQRNVSWFFQESNAVTVPQTGILEVWYDRVPTGATLGVGIVHPYSMDYFSHRPDTSLVLTTGSKDFSWEIGSRHRPGSVLLGLRVGEMLARVRPLEPFGRRYLSDLESDFDPSDWVLVQEGDQSYYVPR